MKFFEAAKAVVESKADHLIRPRKGADMEYDAKPMFTGSKKGWTLLDTFTASAVVKVYENLKDESKKFFDGMPATKAAAVAMKLVG